MGLKAPILRTLTKSTLLFGLIFMFFWLLFYSHLGVRWTIGTINVVTPLHIEYQNAQGHLAGHLSFEGLNIESKNFKLSIQDLHVQWHVLPILTGTLAFDQVMMNGVHYQPLATTDEPTPSPSLEEIKSQFTSGPLNFKVGQFSANDIRIENETPVHIDHFAFTKADTHKKMFVRTLVIEGAFGYLSIVGEQDLNISFDLSISDLSVWSKDLAGDFRGHGVVVVADLNNPIESTDLSMTLESKSLQVGDYQIKHFKGTSKGTLAQFTTQINGDINEHNVELTAHTTRQDHEWKLQIDPSDWFHPKYGKLPKIHGYITFDEKKWQGDMAFYPFKGNQLTGHFQINPKKGYRLTGNLNGQFDDFSFLSKFFPEINKANGHASLNLEISGNVSEPIIKGHALLSDIHVPLVDLGTDLIIPSIELTNSKPGILDIKGHGTLGGGAFTISGQTDFTQDKPTIRLRLKGNQMVLSRTPGYFVVANPDLTLRMTDNGPLLEGNLFIPEAEIHIEGYSNTVAISSDVVIVQDKKAYKPKPVTKQTSYSKLNTNLTITLGDKVKFKGYNLQTMLEGSLQIDGQPDKPLMATGKITLKDGQYKTRGKTLTLTHGQLIYAKSPLANPALDIRGQREIRQPVKATQSTSTDFFEQKNIHHGPLVVGITLKGTLKSPQLRLFSNPHLPEGDVLSYLILDKPQASASFTEGKLLFDAANELIFQFGSKTTDLRPSLIEQFKLDKLELATSPNANGRAGIEDTVLIVGKQFSNRLYAEYSLGIIDTASSVHLRYLVGKHMTLETSASRNSVSADLLFIFENG